MYQRIIMRAIACALLLTACDPCRDLAAAAFEQANIDCVAGDKSACEWLATHSYNDAIDACPVVGP